MKKILFLTGLFLFAYSHLSRAGDIISPPYKGPKLGNFQCIIRNDTNRTIYAIPEWIECKNKGTVSLHGGKELVPGENYNLVTTDKRACRCRVAFDGKPGDITILLASGTVGIKSRAEICAESEKATAQPYIICKSRDKDNCCNWWAKINPETPNARTR